MKLQFGVSTLMIVVTCAAIAIGASTGFTRYVDAELSELMPVVGMLSPFWIPFVVVAYALGSRRITVRLAIGFALLEALAFGTAIFIWWLYN